MYLLYSPPVVELSCLVAAITILSWIASPSSERPMSFALGTRIIPFTMSQWSGFWSFLAVLVPASGLGFSALYYGGQSYTGDTSLYYWLVFSGFALLFGALQVRVARPSP